MTPILVCISATIHPAEHYYGVLDRCAGYVYIYIYTCFSVTLQLSLSFIFDGFTTMGARKLQNLFKTSSLGPTA